MNQNKSFFLVTFTILAVLGIIAAGMYLSKQSESPATAKHTRAGKYNIPRTPISNELDTLKTHEFLDEQNLSPELLPAPTNSRPQPGANNVLTPAQGNRLTVQRNSLPGMPADQRMTPGTDLYTQAAGQAGAFTAPQGSSSRATYPRATAGQVSGGPGQFAPLSTSARTPDANTPFSPYMAALTKEQAEKLDKQLNGLSDRVEAAILRAFLPKSKKDTNIEKYLSRQKGETSAQNTSSASPFAGVANQLNRQKTGLVESMKNAFGDKAAGQAGRIMDSYQKEIMNVLNQPGQTQQQIQQKTRQISQKYNKQLQKLSEKSGLERMTQERTQQDRSFQDDLAKSYGSDMAGQLGEVLEKYRQKDLELAQTQGLSAQEYYDQLLANQRQRRKEMENLLTQNGKSLNGLLEAENKQERTQIDQQLQDEQSGKTLPRAYHASEEEKTAFSNGLQQERSDKAQAAQAMYGQTGADLINNVYDRYYKEASAIMDDEQTSLVEKQQQLMQARQKANAEIERIQNTPQMKTLRENKQVEETLTQLFKDPGLAQATAEQKAQFEKTARPVLHQMFERINAIAADSTLTDEQKQQQIQAVQQEAQHQLSGQ